jgi:Flp pilus assembly pilin Flp
MKSFFNFLRGLWKDESGQSATEYILILAVIVAIVLAVRKFMPGKFEELINTAMEKVTGSISE